MKFGQALIGALLLGMLALASSAYGISISVSSNAGGFTENINAGDGDSVFGSAVIGSESLSNSIKGRDSLKVSHWVSNTAGATAGTGADIRKAESYSYDYYLTPGPGFFWPASRYPVVSASETLDVTNAYYINAYANSFNAQGDSADVSTIVLDPEKKASLTGYSNKAVTSAKKAEASQKGESASAPTGFVQTEAGSRFNQLSIFPLELRAEEAEASTAVKTGSINGYSDQARALGDKLDASQHIEIASSSEINTISKSAFHSASLFRGLKKSVAGASTMSSGNLAGYDGMARVSKDQLEALQSGHIEGTFTGTAAASKASKTRVSNYGHEYDLDMQAKIEGGFPEVSGTLGYYVDDDNPGANRIQGAVDAAESGDAINVLPGTYFENVVVDKSLDVLGAGVGETVVDGNHKGSVFKIGETYSDIDLNLSGMTITNGSGTQDDPDEWFTSGGGIFNKGKMTIEDCLISGNSATYGGGVSNYGTATIAESRISDNSVIEYGGGVYNYYGAITMANSTISGNSAKSFFSGNGGGIYNYYGTTAVTNSTITGNSATWGGGIYNNGGTAMITNSKIAENSVDGWSGGVFNSGTATIIGSNISGNSVYDGVGGGVVNWAAATITIVDSNISANWGNGIWNDGVATIKDSIVSRNSGGNGGGVYSEGIATISGCTISGNSASVYYDGGGVCSYYGTTTITDSIISGNLAGNGGGVYNTGGTINISCSTISENVADQWGGGVANWGTADIADSSISGNLVYRDGGGIWNSGPAEIINSTISGNMAYEDGGGIYNPHFAVRPRQITYF